MIVDDAAPARRPRRAALVRLRDPEATERAFRAGWLHSGDLARMDDDGRVYRSGRTKEMIRCSFENVAAAEVKRVLQLPPSVRGGRGPAGTGRVAR
ncbi:hypothetical protein ACWDKQ_08215 [Saccharopolyspora sp. NPDC000995]